MHALGIFHEQSRPDRDTYVFINLTDVDPWYLYQIILLFSNRFLRYHGNFNKYPFSQVSIEDVEYDYESVMHYG